MTDLSPFDSNDKRGLTTGEALEMCLPVVRRYQGVIGNVLRIKATTPEEEGMKFNRKPDNTQVLMQVQQALAELEQTLLSIEQALEEPLNPADTLSRDF